MILPQGTISHRKIRKNILADFLVFSSGMLVPEEVVRGYLAL